MCTVLSSERECVYSLLSHTRSPSGCGLGSMERVAGRDVRPPSLTRVLGGASGLGVGRIGKRCEHEPRVDQTKVY